MGYITTLAYIDTAEDDHSLPDCDALNFPWPVVRNKQFKQIHSQSAEVSYSPKLGVSKFMVTRAAWGKRDRRSSNHGWSWILRLVFITYHLIRPNRILSGVRNVVYHFMRNGRNLFQFRNRDLQFAARWTDGARVAVNCNWPSHHNPSFKRLILHAFRSAP